MPRLSPEYASKLRAACRRANRRVVALLGLLSLALLLPACTDDGPCPCTSNGAELVTAGPYLYDGSYHEAIGPFHVTDLRSKIKVVEGDSIDTYARIEDYETRDLTVYAPPNASEAPVILYVHGGGWVDGYMHWYDFVAESFTRERGWVTVVINYRLTSDEVFPTAICSTRTSEAPDPSLKAAWYPDNLADCADALQWTLDHIADHGGDPKKIFLFGHSAGGHLAALLAVHEEYADLRPSIRGLVCMSAGYRLTEMNLAVFGPAMEQTFGTATDPAVLDPASPTIYVTGAETLPPLMILYADEDLLSLPEQAIAFSEKLTRLGYDHESHLLEGYDHVSEMQAIEFAGEEPTRRIIEFIKGVLVDSARASAGAHRR